MRQTPVLYCQSYTRGYYAASSARRSRRPRQGSQGLCDEELVEAAAETQEELGKEGETEQYDEEHAGVEVEVVAVARVRDGAVGGDGGTIVI